MPQLAGGTNGVVTGLSPAPLKCNFKAAFTCGCMNTKTHSSDSIFFLSCTISVQVFPQVWLCPVLGCGSYCLAGVSRSHWPAFMRRLPASAGCPCCSFVCLPWPRCSEMERPSVCPCCCCGFHNHIMCG